MKNRIVAALAFGFFILALLPDRIVVVNDDFGYLRSVLETLQYHRPWTNDWLEPWGASLSVICAALYRASGNFYFSTYGVLAASAAVSYFAVSALLERTQPPGRAGLTAALLLTNATLLWKFLEFTSVALYVACLTLALLAAENRRWIVFTAAWCIGIAARQSAVAWAIIPLVHGLADVKADGFRPTRSKLATLASLFVGTATVFWLHRSMNVTHAQIVAGTAAMNLPPWSQMARTTATAGLVVATAIGISAFLQSSLQLPGRREWAIRLGLVGPIVVFVLIADVRRWTGFEHLCYVDGWGILYLKLVFLAAAAGWLFARPLLRWQYCVYAAPAILLVATRRATWDYYFIDRALFGFLAVRSRPLSDTTAAPVRSPWAARSVVVVAVLFHLGFAFSLKATFDRAAALIAVSERAIRDGKLAPTDLSFAPFGYIGWYWYPYYIAHEGSGVAAIDGFGMYLREGAVDVGQAYAAPLHILPQYRHTPPSDRSRLISWGRSRFLWFFWSEYYLLRAPDQRVQPARVVVPNPRAKAFPLTREEWRIAATDSR